MNPMTLLRTRGLSNEPNDSLTNPWTLLRTNGLSYEPDDSLVHSMTPWIKSRSFNFFKTYNTFMVYPMIQ